MTTWDEAKRRINIAKHGVDFAILDGFDWETSDIEEDVDAEYGEQRERATGPVGNTLYVYVYTMRGDEDHAISLRIAEKKERRRYVEKIRTSDRG